MADSVGLGIRLAENASGQVMTQLLSTEKLTAAQMTAIELIGCNLDVQPGRLAKAMALEPSNLASILRRLEEARLIRVKPGHDKRTRVISLTTAGKQMRAAGARLIAHHQRITTQSLTRAEQRLLIDLLQKVAAVNEAAVNE